MQKEQLIFWRNFLLTTLLVTIGLSLLLFTVIFGFWRTWVDITSLFDFDEAMLRQAVLSMIIGIRLFVFLILLCPMIALHITIKRTK